jgi:hypothetical protein
LALALQEAWFQAGTLVLGYQGFAFTELAAYHSIEIAGTAALGPLMHLLVEGAEQFLRRFGWRPVEHSSHQFY